MKPDVLIAGTGLSGSVVARHFADMGKHVLMLERRSHVGGNLHDFHDENGLLLQKYGPHLFHTSNLKLFAYMALFSEWGYFNVTTMAMIDEQYTPCPFNFKTIDQFFGKEKAQKLKSRLHNEYNGVQKVTIVDLLNSNDDLIREFAGFLFEKDYRLYTSKQWGVPPESVDASILKRVPVRLSYEELFFDATIQVLPRKGFARLIKNILDHENILVETGTNAADRLQIDGSSIFFDREKFENLVVYTGAVDELLKYRYGSLPYRSLRFEFDSEKTPRFQPAAVCAYPQADGYTRITEYTQFPHQGDGSIAVFAREYPMQYEPSKNMEPYYPIANDANHTLHRNYMDFLAAVPNLFLCGRLADYKYYYMDQALERALEVCKTIDAKWFPKTG